MGNIQIFTMSFFIYSAFNKWFYLFHLTCNLLTFFFIAFFSVAIIFCKMFQQFFVVKFINNVSLGQSSFNFFNHKNFFRRIWSITLSKHISLFRYFNNTTHFKFSIIDFSARVNICARFYIDRFLFNFTMICIVAFINFII